ncbi:MAG: PD-(D/E)XK nuclease family protein [Nanoarchaeota archaeon]|nr:PD-(D/E)XK nuclease family protein [Nanoarchaeota archaeon]
MPFKLSPSAINLMNECPRCFWLTLHKVWKRPAGIFPSLPSGMDRILKIHFEKFRDKETLPPELYENGHCKNMKVFNDPEKMKIWQSNFKGISWKDEEENELHGAVDNILVNGKKLIVLDYKTRGYALKEDTAEHYRLQQNIYNFLLRKNGYETEDFFFLLFYVPKEVMETGEVIFDTELVKMNVDVKMAEKAWTDALKLLKGDCPTKSCEWCLGR